MALSEHESSDGRSRRAVEKRTARRKKILEIALAVFSDKGYHQTRISDIIETAGIARGTFYLYFDSKNAIFHELLDLLLEHIRDSMVGVDTSPGAPPVRDQVLVSVRGILSAFVESPELTTVVLREAVGIDEEIDRKLRDFYAYLHAWLTDSLENGQRMGLIRELDSEHVAWCILGSVKQFLQLVVDRGDRRHDLEHFSQVILDFTLQGILKTHPA